MYTLYMLFLSLKESIPEIMSKKVKVNPKTNSLHIPPEISMMIRTLNLIYELDTQTPYAGLEKVTFSVELAIWFLTGVTYGNVHYIIPSHL